MNTTSFCEHRFPTDISYGVSGGPSFYTEIVETASGKEYRNIRAPYSRNKYNIASGIRTKEQLQRVMDFFRAVKGKAIPFRFKDWMNFEATQEFIAVADGATHKYQLLKRYRVGSNEEVKKIYKPVVNTVKIYVNDTLETEISVNHTNGTFLFKTLPVKDAIIKASFDFDVPVRFDTDHINASIESYEVHSIDEIPIIEVL